MVYGLYDTYIAKEHAIAYCHFHHCYMNRLQMQRKECLIRKCYRFEKMNHTYWQQKESIKKKRKKKKAAMSEKIDKLLLQSKMKGG